MLRRTITVTSLVNNLGNLFFCLAPNTLPTISTASTRSGLFIDATTNYDPAATTPQGVANTGFIAIAAALGLDSSRVSNARLLSCGVRTMPVGVAPVNMTGAYYVVADSSASANLVGVVSVDASNAKQNDYPLSDIQKLEYAFGALTPESTPRYVWRARTLDALTTYYAPGTGTISFTNNLPDACIIVFTGCSTSQKIQFTIDCVFEVEPDVTNLDSALGYSDCFIDPLPYHAFLGHNMQNFVHSSKPNNMVNMFAPTKVIDNIQKKGIDIKTAPDDWTWKLHRAGVTSG